MEKLMIRNFVDTDAAALEQVIRETWNYDRFSPPQTAQRLAPVCQAHDKKICIFFEVFSGSCNSCP